MDISAISIKDRKKGLDLIEYAHKHKCEAVYNPQIEGMCIRCSNPIVAYKMRKKVKELSK